jgi:hypothetical protein
MRRARERERERGTVHFLPFPAEIDKREKERERERGEKERSHRGAAQLPALLIGCSHAARSDVTQARAGASAAR